MRNLLLALWLAAAGFVAPALAENDLLTTSITGSISASGLDDPQYVLSFVSIQKLMLDATKGPVSERRIRKALEGTPVTIETLLNLGMLKRDGRRYRLAYLVLTRSDQEAIYAVARRYGESLADAIISHADEFNALFTQYDRQDLRDALAFVTISGFSLNWNGLGLASELGYRVTPRKWPNGDRYLFFSRENGVSFDDKGHYLGSNSAPTSPGVFSTFGDGPSQPRIDGLPDVLIEPAEEGLDLLSNRPEVFAAARGNFIIYLLEALNDESRIIMATADGPIPREALAKAANVDPAKFDAALGLLTATGYLVESKKGYRPGVVVLDADDADMLSGIVELSRTIMTAWLKENYDPIKGDLEGLDILDADVPYELVFSEIWHDLFGFSTKRLAEKGFTLDPYADETKFRGFEPAVWSAELADVLHSPF